jgi:hypothetical protein
MKDVRRAVHRFRPLNLLTVWGHKRLPPATPLVRLSERHLRVINLAAARGFETPNRQIGRLPPPVPSRPPLPPHPVVPGQRACCSTDPAPTCEPTWLASVAPMWAPARLGRLVRVSWQHVPPRRTPWRASALPPRAHRCIGRSGPTGMAGSSRSRRTVAPDVTVSLNRSTIQSRTVPVVQGWTRIFTCSSLFWISSWKPLVTRSSSGIRLVM